MRTIVRRVHERQAAWANSLHQRIRISRCFNIPENLGVFQGIPPLKQDDVVQEGLAIEAQVRGRAEALRQWSRDEDGLFAQAWGEAIGTKPCKQASDCH